MSTNFRDIYTQWTQKQAMLSFVMKSARCWAGYEPVPGKAPYSEDSCRPKGSKKKKAPSEKKAGQPYSGPYSSTAFDSAHAAQQLGMPASAAPQQVYNRMMYKHRNGQFTPSQFSAFHSKYNGLPPQFTPPQPAPVAAAPQPTSAPLTAMTQKAGSNECCGPASVPEHTSQEPTKQITPKPAVISHSKQVLTSDPARFGASIKEAIAGEGKGEEKYEPKGPKARLGQSVFNHVEKKHKEELDGVKPSHETSKHISVSRAEPEESEDLRAEEVFPDTRPYSD
jgi:hypothetical protein